MQGTEMYYAVVYFSSLIPLSKLTGYTTVVSACISEVRQWRENATKEQLYALTYALCSWKRGGELIEICLEWLDHAFRPHKLNTTALSVS